MKIRRLIFKLVTLCVLTIGVFFVSTNKSKAAEGDDCFGEKLDCVAAKDAACDAPPPPGQPAKTPKQIEDCKRDGRLTCIAGQSQCYANKWAEWSNWWNSMMNGESHNETEWFVWEITPAPICEMAPLILDDCSNFPTNEEIDACVASISSQVANPANHCPK